MANQTIQEFFARISTQERVQGMSGRSFPVSDGMTKDELSLMNEIIRNDASVTSTLEIGCAVGFSSFAILSALKNRPNAAHTIIDPFQRTQWDGAGLKLLSEHGLTDYHLVERLSELCLPDLLAEGKEFDFILIDGWHTFDHTLIDMFYSLRLLKRDGYLVVDDTSWPAVSRAIAYYENTDFLKLIKTCEVATFGPKKAAKRAISNLFNREIARKSMQLILPAPLMNKFNRIRYGSMVIFQKIGTDERRWDWYRNF